MGAVTWRGSSTSASRETAHLCSLLAGWLERLGGLVLLGGLLTMGACKDEPQNNNNNNNSAPPACGDGVVDPGEQCDDGAANSDVAPDACRTTCRFAHCGDSVVDSDEACDGASLAGQDCISRGHTGGTLRCTSDCQLDESGCSDCGDGQQGPDEECDGLDLANADCAAVSGWQHGVLRCTDTCTYDPSQCHTCGDGVIKEGVEECEPDDLQGATCQSAGFAFGQVACAEPTCLLDTSARRPAAATAWPRWPLASRATAPTWAARRACPWGSPPGAPWRAAPCAPST